VPPSNKLIIDIETAKAFFGASHTLPNVQRVVQTLNQSWNEKYVTKDGKVSN
jgi:hypothetical protein